MDWIAILVSFGGAGWGWLKLAESMKSNGRPWWLRHLAGLSAGWLAMLGILMVFDGVGITLSAETESMGIEGYIYGAILLAPLVISLRLSLTANQRVEAHEAKEARSTLKQLQGENRQSVRDAMSSKRWKQRAKKAKAEAAGKTPKAPPSPTRSAMSSSDGYLRFVYEDSQGNVSTREVSSWDEDGIYIEGYCHRAGDVRTFRRDRIVEFIKGEDLVGPMLEEIDPEPIFTGPAMEILFTGFSSDDREDLEADAEEAGLIIRKTITKNLNFVCAGPRAGATKLRQAQERRAVILDKNQFYELLETGVIPA